MSRERAIRRAERERERQQRVAQEQRRAERSARRRRQIRSVRTAVPRPPRLRRQEGLLARRRRLQNGAVAGLFAFVLVMLWLLADGWWARAGGTVLAVLALPVLVTLVFDRRS